MKRSTVNTLVTLAVLSVAVGIFVMPFFQHEAEEPPESAARVLLPAPTKEVGAAAVARMRIDEDKIERFKRYRAKTTPTHIRERTGIYLSFFEFPNRPANVSAAMHVVFAGDDWIFFESLVSNCDGARFEFEFSPEHHIGARGRVEEWATVVISKRIYFEFLYDCAMAKDATIRLKGKFVYDHTMSPKEKQAIIDTLVAFQAKGGSLDLPYE